MNSHSNYCFFNLYNINRTTDNSSIYFSLFKNASNPMINITLLLPKNLNHGINGLMYCIVGSSFRQELIQLICCRKTFSDRSTKSLSKAGPTQLPTILTISSRE